MSDVKLPERIFRVVFDESVGYDKPKDRQRTKRNYDDARGAAQMIDSINRWPDHHELVGVFVTECHWKPVGLEQLPNPVTGEVAA